MWVPVCNAALRIYATLSTLTAVVVGALAAVLGNGDWRVSVLAGYAGTDLLESLYKIRLTGTLRGVK